MVKVHFGLTHKKVDSVLIIQFFNAGIIWVHNSKRRWELTGGKLEPGETMVQAAVRESYEESGGCKLIPETTFKRGYNE
ncbi:Xanthosine triphosphate pyrophosphatase [Lacticaseibacillus paracasei subsp. paracasei Lpp70]|nr:Xanthosine triphosphate pyrophosphatase [Lacticaseibacillus paracasei subsp. paracasei Lpp70]